MTTEANAHKCCFSTAKSMECLLFGQDLVVHAVSTRRLNELCVRSNLSFMLHAAAEICSWRKCVHIEHLTYEYRLEQKVDQHSNAAKFRFWHLQVSFHRNTRKPSPCRSVMRDHDWRAGGNAE